MYTYNAYGVNFKSDIQLPELGTGDGHCEVEIKVDERGWSDQEILEKSSWVHVGRDAAKLFVRDVGWFTLCEGREVIIKPFPESRISLLRLYLLGSVMAILLYQRGRLVLHASSVLVNGKAIAFLAESGWGKSSLAAALGQRGHVVLSDDLTPVELCGGTACIYPGPAHLKINPEVASLIGVDWDKLVLLDPAERKRYLPSQINIPSRPLPLSGIYVLMANSHHEILPLRLQEAVIELIRHTYPTRLGHKGDAIQLLQCGKLVKDVKIVKLERFFSLTSLSDLATLVENDLAKV